MLIGLGVSLTSPPSQPNIDEWIAKNGFGIHEAQDVITHSEMSEQERAKCQEAFNSGPKAWAAGKIDGLRYCRGLILDKITHVGVICEDGVKPK